MRGLTQPVKGYCCWEQLTFERCADKIAVAPDQPATTHRAETVERSTEVGRHDIQAVYVNNGTGLWPGFALRLGRPSELTRITLRQAR